jgi:hypothetical protein
VIGILGHIEKLSEISDSRKELFYNSPLYFLRINPKWNSETKLLDCEELIIKYWNEK